MFREQKELERLRAEYGMDEDGNYQRQEEATMEAAASRGQISTVDYLEQRVRICQKYVVWSRDNQHPVRSLALLLHFS